MKPIDFVLGAGGHYNTPVGAVTEALKRELVILSNGYEWEVLSYYYEDTAKRMILDIQEKNAKRKAPPKVFVALPSRKQFEAAMTKQFGLAKSVFDWDSDDKCYLNEDTDVQWQTWLLAKGKNPNV